MSTITSYLRFNGNCKEAMSFYKDCLGGELSMQKVGESPMAGNMPQQMQDKIMHATLKNSGFTIMASDLCDEKGLKKGNNVSLMLDCDSEDQIRTFYKKLSEDGNKTHPLEVTFWNALFGDLTDKFGINWLMNYQIESPAQVSEN
ncbi:MAG: VOC family protein [Bacteroidota bacterium]|nr:VOC family protein [Bacteroidota bacterium]